MYHCPITPAFDGQLHSLDVHLETIFQGEKECYENPGVPAYACNPNIREVEVGVQELKASFGCIMSSRTACAT